MNKSYENIPPNLIRIMPGKEVAVEFVDLLGKYMLIVFVNFTSHIYTEVTKEKTFESVKQVLLNYFHTCRLPNQICSDGAQALS